MDEEDRGTAPNKTCDNRHHHVPWRAPNALVPRMPWFSLTPLPGQLPRGGQWYVAPSADRKPGDHTWPCQDLSPVLCCLSGHQETQLDSREGKGLAGWRGGRATDQGALLYKPHPGLGWAREIVLLGLLTDLTEDAQQNKCLQDIPWSFQSIQ